jgi:hypothetical protein
MKHVALNFVAHLLRLKANGGGARGVYLFSTIAFRSAAATRLGSESVNTCGAETAFFGRYLLKNAVFAPQVLNKNVRQLLHKPSNPLANPAISQNLRVAQARRF